jgi:hypothetical protein
MPLIIGALDRARSEKPKPSTQESSTQTNLTWTQIENLNQKIQQFHQNWKASLKESKLKEKVNQALSFRLSVLQKKISNLASEEKFREDNENDLTKEITKLTNLTVSSPKDLESILQSLEKIFSQPKYQEDHRTIEEQWFTEQLTKLAKIKSSAHNYQLLSSQRELEITSLQKQLSENKKQWEVTKNQIQIDQKRLIAKTEEEREELIEAHEKALKKRDQQIATLQKTIEDLKIASSTTQANLEQKINDLGKLDQTQKALIKKYLQVTFSLTLQLASKEQEVARQQKKIVDLEDNQQALEMVRNSLQRQLEQDSGSKQDLQKEIKRKNAEIYELEEKVKQAQKDLDTLRQEKQVKEDELNQNIFALKQEIQSLKNLSEKDQASLNSEINKLRQELLTAREQINSLKDQVKRITELEKQIKTNAAQSLETEEKLKQQIKVQADQITNQKQQIKNLEEQVNQSMITDAGEKQFFAEVFPLTSRFTDLFTSLKSPTVELPSKPIKWQEFQQWYITKFRMLSKGGDNLTTGFLPNPLWKYPQVWLQVNQWLTNLNQAIENLDSARKEIQQQKLRESDLQKEISQLKNTAEQSKLGGQQLQSQVTNLQQTIQQHERTIKELQATILELEEKLKQKNSTYETLQREYRQAQEQLQQRIGELENQAITDRQTISNLENNLQSLQNKVRDVEDLLNTANQEKEAMNVEKERLLSQKNELADRIANLERAAQEKERQIKLQDDKALQYEDSLNSLRELLATAEIRLQEGELTTEEKSILGEIRILLQEINLAQAGHVENNLTRIQNRNQSIVRLFLNNPSKYSHLGNLLANHFTPQSVFVKNIVELIRELKETREGLEIHKREAIEKGRECEGLIREKSKMQKLLNIHRNNMVWMGDGDIDFTQGINQQQFFNEMPNLKIFYQKFDEDKKNMVPDVPIYLKGGLRMISLAGEPNSANLDIIIDSIRKTSSNQSSQNNELEDAFITDNHFDNDNTDNYRRLWHVAPFQVPSNQGDYSISQYSGTTYHDSSYRSFNLPAASFHHSNIRQSLQNDKQIIHLDNRKVKISDSDEGRTENILYDPSNTGGMTVLYYKIESLEKNILLKVGFYSGIVQGPYSMLNEAWKNPLPEDNDKPCFNVDCEAQFIGYIQKPKVKKVVFKFTEFPWHNRSQGDYQWQNWKKINDWYQEGTTHYDFRLVDWAVTSEREEMIKTHHNHKPLTAGFGNYIAKFKGFIEPGYGWLDATSGNMLNITNQLRGFYRRSRRLCWKVEPKSIASLPKMSLNIFPQNIQPYLNGNPGAIGDANKTWLRVDNAYYNSQPIKYLVFSKEKIQPRDWNNFFQTIYSLRDSKGKTILTFEDATCNLSLGDSFSVDFWQRQNLARGNFLSIEVPENKQISFEIYRKETYSCDKCKNKFLTSEILRKEFNCMRSNDSVASVKENIVCPVCKEVIDCQFGGKCFPVGMTMAQIAGGPITPREIIFYWQSYHYLEENTVNSRFIINIRNEKYGTINNTSHSPTGPVGDITRRIILTGDSIWDSQYGRSMKDLFDIYAREGRWRLKIVLIGTAKFEWGKDPRGYASTDVIINGDFSIGIQPSS